MDTDFEQYLNEMTNIQSSILEFLENDGNLEEKYQNLTNKLEDLKIRNSKHNLRLILHFILNISNNYHRSSNFYDKIDQILQQFKDEIKNFYSNTEIFNIFKTNKRILLFLIEEKILTVDKYFCQIITTEKYVKKNYPEYFAPEIKPLLNETSFVKTDLQDKWILNVNKELPENFNELRKKGENENFICKLIREEKTKDFIAYVNKNNISLESTIQPSIYETNSFLIKKQTNEDITLIEYAVFFGSIEIFNYLKIQGVKLDSSLWIYSIHGKNAEIIHSLEEKKVDSNNNYLLNESIKCNHNDIANYIIINYLQDEKEEIKDTFMQSLKFYNFAFLEKEKINESYFGYLCKFDYYSFVNQLLLCRDIDVNSKIIQNRAFKYYKKLYHSMKFIIIQFNEIYHHIIQKNSKSYISITFKIISFIKFKSISFNKILT